MKQEKSISKLDSKTDLDKILTITVPKEIVSDSFSKTYKSLQSQAHIKGFRKGHTPLNQVKKIYGQKAHQQVLQDLVDKHYRQALAEHNLLPTVRPDVDIKSFDEDKELVFVATLEVQPEIVIKSKKFKVKKRKFKEDPKKVDEFIEKILHSSAKNTPVLEDRAVKNKDTVDIDFEGFLGTEPLKNGKANNYLLEIGSNSFISGFEEKIIGMKVGSEREIDLNFPEDYFEKSLQGQPVRFKVKLNKILEKKTPELTDEWVAQLNMPFKTVDDLKKFTTERLESEEKANIEKELRQSLLDEFVKENPFPVPTKLKEKQKQHLVDQSEQDLQRNQMSADQIKSYKEKWNEEFDKMAEHSVRLSLLVGKLTGDNPELQADDEQVKRRLMTEAQRMNLEPKQIQELLNSDKFFNVKYQMTEEKVYQYLLSQSEVKEA